MAFAPTSGKPRSSARRGRKPRGENNARPGQATPSARRGAAAVAPPRPTLTPGKSGRRLPGPGPLCHRGVPGRGGAPEGTGTPPPPPPPRRGPHSPAGSQASSSAHRQRPRWAMARPPPPARGRQAGPPRRAHGPSPSRGTCPRAGRRRRPQSPPSAAPQRPPGGRYASPLRHPHPPPQSQAKYFRNQPPASETAFKNNKYKVRTQVYVKIRTQGREVSPELCRLEKDAVTDGSARFVLWAESLGN